MKTSYSQQHIANNSKWKNRPRRIHNISFYLYKVQKQFYIIVSQDSDYTFREKERGNELERDFWGINNVTFLDLDDGFMDLN